RQHLLARCGADVERRDDPAEPTSGGDGLQSGDASADDEHLCGRHSVGPRGGGGAATAETPPRSRRAVAMACSPATPAPMTNTFAGDTVPAAVVSIGRNLGSAPAPMSAAW